MDTNLDFVYQNMLLRTKSALEKNNMQAFIVQSAAEVVPLLQQLIPAGASVSNGGSISLAQTGAIQLLRNGAYQYLDRDAPGADRNVVHRQAFGADVYLASANAITQNGEIYEVDGRGNRVAAIAYGPDSVILVAGRNKIVPTLEDARQRRAQIAAPANVKRLGLKTPCNVTGTCSNCKSPARICCIELVLQQQQTNGRIKVILVNEELGY